MLHERSLLRGQTNPSIGDGEFHEGIEVFRGADRLCFEAG